jgi:hypothetical protein
MSASRADSAPLSDVQDDTSTSVDTIHGHTKVKTVSFGGVCPDAPNRNVGIGVPKTLE